ncbi:uncharacterized protein METZ01_LOCUS53 [marine metagenome]|uniref:Uncharacterized protein n=1 Tax=marine metagenome TaxID=408172 RepID=A0A381MY52_9ZZZZ
MAPKNSAVHGLPRYPNNPLAHRE